MNVGPIICEDPEIRQHMRASDIPLFAATAKLRNAYILVRRTNAASIPYVGRPGFEPKPIDCKAKTADNNVTLFNREQEVAGLVVDPGLVGAAAFRSVAQFEKATAIWQDFRSHLAPPGLAYVTDDRRFGVQDDPKRPRYGAVVMWRNGHRHPNAEILLHGDYDLFSIVPADNPASHVFVQETLLGQPHARGQLLMDVQFYLNARMGVPMIRHGEQDNFSDSFDDKVDIFCPDGLTVKTREGPTLRAFFQTELNGRRPHQAGAPTQPAGGLWRRV